MPEAEDASVPRLSLAALFAKFLGFGVFAFGGPVAQIAMIRQSLVEEEKWISSARFNRLLAVMQVLPGPEAHELCVHMGMMARGRVGGLLAGLGFMLPGFLLMLGCGWAYTEYIQGREELAGILLGVQVAVLAVIARSVQRIGTHILAGAALWSFAVIAALATLAGVPFWAPLLAAAIACSLPGRPMLGIALATAMVVIAWWLFFAGEISSTISADDHRRPADSLALFMAGLKGGLLTFGGAYTAIPYVRADTVGRGWLGDGAFLDGVALANVIPAPLVIFSTFVGYLASGLSGAVATTVGMFLPAFAFSLVFYERLEGAIDHPRLHRALDGIAAAAVGIIFATVIQLAASAFERLDAPLMALPIFIFSALAAWKLKGKWVTPAIVAAGAAAGAVLLS